MADGLPDIGAFGAAFQEFMTAMVDAAERPESSVVARTRAHLDTDPRELPVTAAEFATTDHANLQLALDDLLGDAEVVGYSAPQMGFGTPGLTERLADQGFGGPVKTGPVQYMNVLFELLNQMEGLADDADLLFLLTSNRPDVLEPALAARPGRIDLALEIPLPADAARVRLLRLYAGAIALDAAAERDAVARTEGVSGAFVKELMRQAALRAALADREAESADVTAALDELLADRSALTRRLLGRRGEGDGDGDDGGEGVPPLPQMVRAIEAAGLPFPFPFQSP